MIEVIENMENVIQYLKIWQKKRDELRLDTDADSDWPEMNTLLDKHMPISNGSNGATLSKE